MWNRFTSRFKKFRKTQRGEDTSLAGPLAISVRRQSEIRQKIADAELEKIKDLTNKSELKWHKRTKQVLVRKVIKEERKRKKQEKKRIK